MTSLEDFGERKCDEYRTPIRSALNEIATNPTGPHSIMRSDLDPNVRTFHIGRRGMRARHLFVYRLKANRRVDVARFLYDTMDIAQHVPTRFRASE